MNSANVSVITDRVNEQGNKVGRVRPSVCPPVRLLPF